MFEEKYSPRKPLSNYEMIHIYNHYRRRSFNPFKPVVVLIQTCLSLGKRLLAQEKAAALENRPVPPVDHYLYRY